MACAWAYPGAAQDTAHVAVDGKTLRGGPGRRANRRQGTLAVYLDDPRPAAQGNSRRGKGCWRAVWTAGGSLQSWPSITLAKEQGAREVLCAGHELFLRPRMASSRAGLCLTLRIVAAMRVWPAWQICPIVVLRSVAMMRGR